MNCSVVIPVYRGAATLVPLVEELVKILPTVSKSYEVILVNDGSPDESWSVIEGLSRDHECVRGIELMRNYGQENATLCGIRAACYEVIVTMDDDLQHNPKDLPTLLAKLEEGFDVVYGVPRIRRQDWWKSFSSAFVKRVIASLIGSPTIRDISSYKVVRARLRQAFDAIDSPDVQIDALLSWATTRFASVQIEESPRAQGRSNYDIRKLIKVTLLVMTNYTTIPLRLASMLGFIFTVIGFFVLIYVIVVYFSAGSIPGFTFLASAITIFSGVQLFALGIIGEYLARIFERSAGRAAYVISQTIPASVDGHLTNE